MGAHAYPEPYAFDRRHALHILRNTQGPIAKKTAEIIVLPSREYTQPKAFELVYPRSNTSTFLALLVMVGIHVAAVAYFQFRPEQPIVQAKIPPMTVELARPQPPQPVQPPIPEPVKPPPPKVEQPRPIAKPKPAPKPLPVVEQPVVEQVVVPQPVVPPPPQPVAAPVTPATADPGYLRNPAPEYPEFAQAQGWEGTVLLDVHVLSTGRPASVDLKQSSGRKILDTAAIQTVKGWKFVPAKQGENAIDSWVEVPIDFKLVY
jgi:protein TonB